MKTGKIGNSQPYIGRLEGVANAEEVGDALRAAVGELGVVPVDAHHHLAGRGKEM